MDSKNIPIIKHNHSKIKITPGLAYDCRGCGFCCRKGWCINITESEREKILEFDWVAKYPHLKGVELIIPYGNSYRFSLDENDKCYFLDEDNLCLIHLEFGLFFKAFTCKFYPLIITETKGEVRIGAHYSCPAVVDGGGRLLSENKEVVLKLFDEYKTKHFRGDISADGPLWDSEQNFGWENLELFESYFSDILTNEKRPMIRRIIHCSYLLDLLEEYFNIDSESLSFHSLISDMNKRALDYSDNLGLKDAKLSVFERLLLRLYVGFSSDMMMPGLLSNSFFTRSKARLSRLVVCVRFFFGIGKFTVDGKEGMFSEIKKTTAYPLVADGEKIISDYLFMRIFCRTYFGKEGWGLGVLHGSRFLLSLYSVIIIAAKMYSFARNDNKNNAIIRDDIKSATMLVDHTFGHLANLNNGFASKVMSYLNRSKWVERAALFATMQ